MKYLKLFEKFGDKYNLYKYLNSSYHNGEYSHKPKESITKLEFIKIKSILNKYGIFDKNLDFNKTLKEGDKLKFNELDPDGCRVDIDVTNYKGYFNCIVNIIILKLKDEYWYVYIDSIEPGPNGSSSYVCDTLEGFEQLVSDFSIKNPTKFNKIKSKLKNLLGFNWYSSFVDND